MLASSLSVESRIALLQDSLGRWPNHLRLKIEASNLLLATEEYQEALKVLDTAKPASRRGQTLVDEHRSVAYLNLGNAAKAKSLLEPEATLSRSQKRYSHSLQCYVHALIDLGELSDARNNLDLISTWRLDKPNRATFLLERVRLEIASGHSDGAIKALSESLELRPNNVVRLFRTLVFVWQGKIEIAQSDSRKYSTEGLPKALADIPRLVALIARQEPGNLSHLQDQIGTFAQEQSGYLLLATHYQLSQDYSAACSTLDLGKRESRSSTLLSPPWSSDCPTEKQTANNISGLDDQ